MSFLTIRVANLMKMLRDPEELWSRSAAQDLVLIADAANYAQRTDMIADLRVMATALSTKFPEDAAQVNRDVAVLEAIKHGRLVDRWEIIAGHSRVASGVIAYLALALASLGLLWARPLALWRINELLGADRKVKLPQWLLGLEISLANLLLVGLFRYHHRVLDAWVAKHIVNARRKFSEKRTVQERKDHVPVPSFDGKRIIEDEEEMKRELKAIFAQNPARLLVWGEGGSGKTSLACRIGRLSMAEDVASRPAAWPMLPVLIEEDLKLEVGKDKTVLTEMIRGQLRELAGLDEAPHEEFVRRLLRRQRILLIVDGLSELNDATRDKLSPVNPEFDANALLITSRLEEALSSVHKRVLRPLRIEGGRLSSFMEAYLQQQGTRSLFDDDEFFENCRRLSVMVGNRDATVLLVRLFADQMVAAKRGNTDTVAGLLPETVPELMLEYLNRLNAKKPQDFDNPTVQAAAKTIAWECLRHNYRPASAGYQAVVAALAQSGPVAPLGEEGAKAQINYLREKLKVVQEIKGGSELKLTLDPLAEYLAALHLIDTCGDDKDAWHNFLERADNTPDAPEAIKGFLLALHDCWLQASSRLSRRDETDTQKFVTTELEKRAGVDPALVKQLRLEQRIKDLISRLSLPFADDRATAAEALGKLGDDAELAVPALIRALKDSDAQVRAKATEALGGIGSNANSALPELITSISDQDELVRLNALTAAWSIAPQDPALVHAMISSLKDPGQGAVRMIAATHLKQISPNREAIAALIDALEDEAAAFFAFQTLEEYGPEVVSSIPAEKLRRYKEWVEKHSTPVPASHSGPEAKA